MRQCDECYRTIEDPSDHDQVCSNGAFEARSVALKESAVIASNMDALRARVAELEAERDEARRECSVAVRMCHETEHERDAARKELAAANADRARLRVALDHVECGVRGRCPECDAREMLASSDASARLHAHDMRVAEAVREAFLAIPAYLDDSDRSKSARLMDLAAVVAGVK